MKEVYYSDKKLFILTEQEFKEAQRSWDKKRPYKCGRLGDVLLTRQFKWIDVPDEDKDDDGRLFDEVFVALVGGKIKKVWRRGDKYFIRMQIYNMPQSRGVLYQLEKAYTPEQIQTLKSNMTNQEDYYNNQIKSLNGHNLKYLS